MPIRHHSFQAASLNLRGPRIPSELARCPQDRVDFFKTMSAQINNLGKKNKGEEKDLAAARQVSSEEQVRCSATSILLPGLIQPLPCFLFFGFFSFPRLFRCFRGSLPAFVARPLCMLSKPMCLHHSPPFVLFLPFRFFKPAFMTCCGWSSKPGATVIR